MRRPLRLQSAALQAHCSLHAPDAGGQLRCSAVLRRRNDIVTLDLMMTLLTACFGLVAMVAGIFGAQPPKQPGKLPNWVSAHRSSMLQA